MAKKKQSEFDLIQSGKYNGKEYKLPKQYDNDFDAIQNGQFSYRQKQQEEQKQQEQKQEKDSLINRVGNSLKSGWFNDTYGIFEDGYQFGDFTKGAISTTQTLKQKFQKGFNSPVEAALDIGANAIVSGGLELAGQKEAAQKVREWAQKDYITESQNKGLNKYIDPFGIRGGFKGIDYTNLATGVDYAISNKDASVFNPLTNDSDKKLDEYAQKNTVAGEKVQGIAQGAGQLAAQAALKQFGVPWQLTAFSTGMGNEMNEAFANGATYGQALASGIISGAVEVATEKIGGLGESILGTKTLTGMLTKGLGKKIGKSIPSYLLKLGINGASEGIEEILSGIGNAFGKKLTYMKDKPFDYSVEQAADDFVTSAIVATLAGGATTYNQYINKVNPWTELTDAQQNTKDAAELLEKQGVKLTDVNKGLLNNMSELYQQMGKEVSSQQLAEQYQEMMNNRIEDFKNSSVEMFPNLDANSRVLFNNLVNDMSNVIADTGVSMTFDPTIDNVFEWDENGVLRLNPTKTNMPIKTVVLQELSNKLLDNQSKSTIISNLKKKGVYDTLKQQLLALGQYDAANVDNEIIARELSNILTNEELLNEYSKTNKSMSEKIKGLFETFNQKLTNNRNTYDSAFIKQVNDNFGRLNLNENINQNEFKNKKSNIQGLEDYSREEIKDSVKYHIEQALSDMDIDADIVGMEIIGSRNRGNAKTSSDLDVVVELKGDNLREDDLFNSLNEDKLEIEGIPVDINPIIAEESGTLDQYLERSNQYDKEVLAKENKKEVSRPATLQGSEKQDFEITSYDSNISQNNNDVNQGETRKTYESIIKSENQSEEAKKIAKELMGSDTYIPDSNQKQIERADEKIKTYGVEKSLDALKQNVETRGKLDVDDIAIGERLIDYYSKVGDAKNLQEAIQLTAMAGTIAGRSVQAMAMINRQSPKGQVTWIQRSVDRMNKQLRDNFDKSKLPFKKLQQFDFTPEMQQKILKSTDANLEQNLNEVYAELGKQVKMSGLEALDAWRYFAMLSSPTTHIRNIVGNLLMGKMQQAKNIIKGGIEDVYYGVTGKEGERTKTLKFTPKKYVEYAKSDIDNVKSQLGFGDNKYTNPKTQLQQNMRMFSDTPAGRFLEKFVKKGMIDTTSKLLEVEDIWGLKAAYTKSLSQYLYANNMDLDNITDKQLAQARKFAIDQAKQATFHQDSAIASAINTIENQNLLTKIAVGGVVPFKKTPINVAKTSLEYNPVGLMKSLTYDSYQLANGKITANQYIDNISKGLTGTGIAILGFALAQAGIIRTSKDDEENYDEDRGIQPYSIRIGNKTISLDWLSPTAVPLFVGAELYNQFSNMNNEMTEEEKQSNTWNSLLNLMNAEVSSLNPVSEMTMLSGIQSALKTYSGDYAKAIEEIGTNTIKTYVNQFTPSILGKVAKSTDEFERSTTSTKKSTVEKAIDSVVKQTMSKIPGLRQLLPKKTDVWGNEIKQNENPLLRTAYNLTSPANIKDVRNTELDKEIERLYNSTGNTSVLPKTYTDKYFKIDNKEYRLSTQEYAAYKQLLGKENYEKLNTLINSSEYKKLSDEDKASVISKVFSYDRNSMKEAYANIHNIKYDSTSYQTEKSVEKLGGSVVEYYLYKANLKSDDDTYTKRGKLKNMSISNNSKSAIYESSVSKATLDLYKVLKESNVNINSYLDYLSREFKADTDRNGNSISGSKKAKVYNYMNSKSNLTYEQKLLILSKEYALSNAEKTYVAYRIYNSRLNSNEKQELYKSLSGFKVDLNGNVRW